MAQKISNKIIPFLLTMLGFTAAGCSGVEMYAPADMYGTPYVKYRASGKVTDTDGNPIKQIAVSTEDTHGVSDADGNYTIESRTFALGASNPLKIVFEDTDGAANGGDFEKKTVDATFTEENRTEDGSGWYGGTYEKSDIDVELNIKK